MFFDDVSTDAAAWSAGNSLTNGIGDQTLTTPPITLPAALNRPITLQFDTHHQLETDGAANCWDGGFVEISTDDGATLTALGKSRTLNCCQRLPIKPAQLKQKNPS